MMRISKRREIMNNQEVVVERFIDVNGSKKDEYIVTKEKDRNGDIIYRIHKLRKDSLGNDCWNVQVSLYHTSEQRNEEFNAIFAVLDNLIWKIRNE